MKLHLIFIWLLLGSIHGFSQNQQTASDTLSKGTFILHKFQQAIGKETYAIIERNDSINIVSDFKFNDRGKDVPLATKLVLNKRGIPVYFKSKGMTSRHSFTDAVVWMSSPEEIKIGTNSEVYQKKITEPFFMINGYSPVAVQMQLIKFWKAHNKPEFITTYPSGEVKVAFSGYDTITHQKKTKILERYFISGLIWGKEMIWTEQDGSLVSLFTNDAEGDKFEAIEESYIDLLPDFISMAASYGVADMHIESISNNPMIALTNANIIDVHSGTLTNKGTLLIKNGVIHKIGITDQLYIPAFYKKIDLQGKTILPGLWDMHAHYQQVEWGPAYLACGITTVRDCGNEFDFINSVKEAIDQGKGSGPRIIKAGLVDGDSPKALGIIRANTPEEATAVVKKYKEAGFEQIKIYSSVKPEIIKFLAEEAHAQGLTITGHVPNGVSLLEAIAMGQDQINHITNAAKAFNLNKEEKNLYLKDTSALEVFNILKDKKIAIDPTLAYYEWGNRPLSDPLNSFEPGVDHIPDVLRMIFQNVGIKAEQFEKSKWLGEIINELVLTLHQYGIPIVAGSDMQIPGYTLLREIELYNEAGLTPIEAIRTATIVPAKVMKKDNLYGSVEEGKKADLVILDKNPLENISNIRTINLVVKDGKIFDPEGLRKLVGFK